MMTPLADFPVRPRMEEGESLAGYISRFHGVNGHVMLPEVHDALRILYRGTPGKASAAFDLVQSLLGNVVQLDRSWWLDRPTLVARPSQYLQVWPTPKFNAARFCPACLLEKGFHFALWEQPLVEVCPVHRYSLLTACPACSRNLFWSNVHPDWRCRCGEPIKAMRARRAMSRAQGVSRAVAGSSDVILPIHFREDFGIAKHGNYSFDEAYAAFTWGTKLRKLFLKQGSPLSLTSSHGRPSIKRQPGPGLWEYRLVIDSTEKLISRLLRVLQRRFKGQHFLRFVYPNDGLIHAQDFVLTSMPGKLQRKINQAREHFLTRYVIQLPTSLFIWCSEEAGSTRRNRLMCGFAAWWGVLSSHIGDLDPAMSSGEFNRPRHGEAHDVLPKEMQVVEVLNLLFDAAVRHIDPGRFRELVYWWRIPPGLRDIGNPDETFRRIGLHLLSVPTAEVAFVHALLQPGFSAGRP
jgi:hypothetical protein